MIKIACNMCGAQLTVPEEARRKKGRCPKCREIVLVPLEGESDAPPPIADSPGPIPAPPPAPFNFKKSWENLDPVGEDEPWQNAMSTGKEEREGRPQAFPPAPAPAPPQPPALQPQVLPAMQASACPECGGPVSRTAKTCPRCGRNMSAGKPEESIATIGPCMFRARPVEFVICIALCIPPFTPLGILIFLFWFLAVLGTRLAVTSKRIIYRRGIVSKRTVERRHEDIRSIDVKQAILERLLGTGSIQVPSAASASASAAFVVKDIVAPQRFADLIRQHQEIHR